MEKIGETMSLVLGLAVAVLILAGIYAGYNVVINLMSGAPLMTNF